MNVVDECGCAKPMSVPMKTTEPGSPCHLRQVKAPDCVSYDTFYKALQFTYCGEVDPSSPVPHSPNSIRKVRACV